MRLIVALFAILFTLPAQSAEASRSPLRLAQTTLFSGAPLPPVLVMPAANNLSANWQMAGLLSKGGIPTRSTQCGSTINPSGIIPPAAGDDYSLIVAVIAACTAGQVIILGTGTFNFAQSELPINVNKGITIRGTGSPVGACNAATGTPCWGTVLQTYDGPQPTYNAPAECGVTLGGATTCPNGSGMFLVDPEGLFNTGLAGCAWPASNVNPTTSSCGTTLVADAAQGSYVVSVNSTTNLSVGAWVVIDENPQLTTTTNPIMGQASLQATPSFLNSSPSPVTGVFANPDSGNFTYAFVPNRVTEEMHLITAIASGPCPCNVTFDSPLMAAFRQSASHDARVYWLTQQSGSTPIAALSQASIENMTIMRCNGGCVNYQFCAYCWASNLETAYWIGGGVNFIASPRGYIYGSYIHDCIDCQNNGEEYPVGMSTASTECLLENNIITFGGKGMVGRAAAGCVVAYNYQDITFYEQAGGIGDYWNDMGLNCSHYAGTHGCLFEGNRGTNCDNDETHGSSSFHVYAFNQCVGMRTTFVDPSNSKTVNDCAGIGYNQSGAANAPSPLRAAGPMALNYWNAFIGNVLGFSGIQSCSGGAFTYGGSTSLTNRMIWFSGWTGSEWSNVPDSNLDGSVARYLFKNCNYDYVTTSQTDCAVGYAHTFPNSLYLPSSGASPPSWWPSGSTTYPFPWVVASGSPPIKTNSIGGPGLPAYARYLAGTPFNDP